MLSELVVSQRAALQAPAAGRKAQRVAVEVLGSLAAPLRRYQGEQARGGCRLPETFESFYLV